MSAPQNACRFVVDKNKCVGCGHCAQDCVADIIVMKDGKPEVPPEKAADGIGCQHCLAICPVGAVSVLGLSPNDSLPLAGAEFAPESLALLARARRSVRAFRPEPVPHWLLDKLLDCAAYAPTGVNSMSRRIAVIRDPKVMDQFRRRAAELAFAKKAELSESVAWLADLAGGWLNGGPDELFRGAPHLLVLSAPKDAPCPVQDCIIELAYFDLLAQAHGVGTVWAGIVYWLLTALPELRSPLGIPEDHELAYAMMFGMPKMRYARTVQRKPENIAYIDAL